MHSGNHSTNAPLNFGPSEQTASQRQLIADQALDVLRASGEIIHGELLALYEQYIAGEADLYAISVLVSEHARQRLREVLPTR